MVLGFYASFRDHHGCRVSCRTPWRGPTRRAAAATARGVLREDRGAVALNSGRFDLLISLTEVLTLGGDPQGRLGRPHRGGGPPASRSGASSRRGVRALRAPTHGRGREPLPAGGRGHAGRPAGLDGPWRGAARDRSLPRSHRPSFARPCGSAPRSRGSTTAWASPWPSRVATTKRSPSSRSSCGCPRRPQVQANLERARSAKAHG